MKKINVVNRVQDLVAVHGSQSKVAKILKVSQSYISRLMSGKRGKRLNPKISKSINSKWRYANKTYFYQPRMKVKVDRYKFPIWVSGDLVALELLQDSKIRLLADLQERYEEVQIILLRTRRFDKDYQYS